MPLQLPALYPLTDENRPEALETQVARLGAAGFSLVQVRAKALPADALMDQLRRIQRQAQAEGGWPRIVLNDRADMAVLLAREGLAPWGLHLGQEDLPPCEARALPGLEALHLGTSTHGPEEWAGVDPACDHAGVGPFRATPTKGDHAEPIGLEGLQRGCARLRSQGISPIGIGGLTPADLEDGFRAGAESLAMVGAVHALPDPAELGWRAQAARWRVRPPVTAGQGLVLLGASGAGKSTLGPVLARLLGLAHRDLDAEIEAQERASVAEIFRLKGEPAFRELEGRVLPSLLATPAVVSLGGGAWELPEVREATTQAGFKALWLAEPPRACWERVALDQTRPLAQEEARFMARCAQRLGAWSLAEPASSFGHSVEALAQALLNGVG
ncbi:MAG TPA: shikimate kinase [Holophagaceae bacterium]|nr:shikimate kinase [Geothrix sp.]HJW33152.1 shikimate kinase [Holophagaceae bacterium]